MSAALLMALVGSVALCGVGALVWSGSRRAKARVDRRVAFERSHGLRASIEPAELGSRYLATGTVRDVPLTIESERVRRARGAGYVTRVSGTAAVAAPPLVVLRRSLQDSDASVGVGLPEQRLEDPAFEAAFRTLCASAEDARAVLTPELRQRLRAQVGAMRFGIRSLEVTAAGVVYTMAWTLCFGMQPEMQDAVEGALEVVTDLCQAPAAPATSSASIS